MPEDSQAAVREIQAIIRSEEQRLRSRLTWLAHQDRHIPTLEFSSDLWPRAATFDGRVLSLVTDPLREPGATVVRILRRIDEESCRYGC